MNGWPFFCNTSTKEYVSHLLAVFYTNISRYETNLHMQLSEVGVALCILRLRNLIGHKFTRRIFNWLIINYELVPVDFLQLETSQQLFPVFK